MVQTTCQFSLSSTGGSLMGFAFVVEVAASLPSSYMVKGAEEIGVMGGCPEVQDFSVTERLQQVRCSAHTSKVSNGDLHTVMLV